VALNNLIHCCLHECDATEFDRKNYLHIATQQTSIHLEKTRYNTCENKFLQTVQVFFGSTVYMYPAFYVTVNFSQQMWRACTCNHFRRNVIFHQIAKPVFCLLPLQCVHSTWLNTSHLYFCTTICLTLEDEATPYKVRINSVTQVISQKARILSYTSIRTSKLAIYFTLFRSCAKPWQVCAIAFTLRALFSELYVPCISKIWSKGHIHLFTRVFNGFTTF